MKLPVNAEKLIPHRGTMKLLDRFLESDGKRAVAETTIAVDSTFVVEENGLVQRCVLIELIAQSYAASKTHKDILEGKTGQDGYLVGVSKSTFTGDAIAGELITIEVHDGDIFGDFHLAQGFVSQGDKLLLDATLKIWVVPQ